jgi:hypothetical protein
MKLDPKTPDRLIHAARRFDRIEQRFAEFKVALEWFKRPEGPLSSVTVELGDDPRCVAVSFATIKVDLQLLLVIPDNGVATGQVICTKVLPKYGELDQVLASFTFDAQGRTSFVVGANDDPVEVEQHAVEIVLHLLELAARPEELDSNQGSMAS